MSKLLAILKVGLLAGAVLPGIPAQWLALRLNRDAARKIPVLFHRWVNWVFGIRRTVIGAPSPDRPLLLLSNHVSWLDITVLSAVAPVSFIAKSEVAGWPLFGTFARLQRTVFVERERRSGTGAVNAEIAGRLQAGDLMILFAEGTSGDGTRVLPFRSALVGAVQRLGAEGAARSFVQPLCITYTRRDGVPIPRNRRAELAWYGDMDLLPHLWAVLRGGAIDVEIRFGAPVAVHAASDRKHIARAMEAEVRKLNGVALGRPAALAAMVKDDARQ